MSSQATRSSHACQSFVANAGNACQEIRIAARMGEQPHVTNQRQRASNEAMAHPWTKWLGSVVLLKKC